MPALKTSPPQMIGKILIANRGEIACRIIRSARKMGIVSVAVASDSDRWALHAQMADETIFIGGHSPSDSYLDSDKILDAAVRSGADAVHPGYGFLSENAEFAKACGDRGLIFIGPSADIIAKMGLKDVARGLMQEAGVPIVPEIPVHFSGSSLSSKTLKSASDIGYPLLVKAAAGGGGKGMRKVDRPEELVDSILSCQREAQSSFGNDTVFVEKYIESARHIEVQIFGDHHGQIVHMYDRDCSLQRRHQKVVEEAPAPGIPSALRGEILDAALKGARAIGYHNAGTIEFILDVGTTLSANSDFYFMEMNTRLQVEHPITEMITGLDLVEWQIRVAQGESLPLMQQEIAQDGHAFEVRLYAEDPARNFIPQTGNITGLQVPVSQQDIRFESGVAVGDYISPYYDPMLAKLCTAAPNRKEAVKKMDEALSQIMIAGVNTNHTFLSHIFKDKDFLVTKKLSTAFIEEKQAKICAPPVISAKNLILILKAAARAFLDVRDSPPPAKSMQSPWSEKNHWRLGGPYRAYHSLSYQEKNYSFEIVKSAEQANLVYEQKTYEISEESAGLDIAFAILDDQKNMFVNLGGGIYKLIPSPLKSNFTKSEESASSGARIIAPMPGRITEILAKNGDHLEENQPILRMEAMKIETTLTAPQAGILKGLNLKIDETVTDGQILVEISVK